MERRINSVVYVIVLNEPMKFPLSVSPKWEISRGEEKISNLDRNRAQDLRMWSSVALPTELRGQTGASRGWLWWELRQCECEGYKLVLCR